MIPANSMASCWSGLRTDTCRAVSNRSRSDFAVRPGDEVVIGQDEHACRRRGDVTRVDALGVDAPVGGFQVMLRGGGMDHIATTTLQSRPRTTFTSPECARWPQACLPGSLGPSLR